MRVGLLTREFPPDVYGGAGVHVDFLSRELRSLVDLTVLCMGEPRPGALAFADVDPRLADANPTLRTISADLAMAAACRDLDVVHSHTWYTNLAGYLASELYDVPLVVTAHSLEPRRPWKAEQLGTGYRVSSWAERTAYLNADAVIAVSRGMARDVSTAYPQVPAERIRVIYNGVDADFYHPDPATDRLRALGVTPGRPYVAFVGRVTRQKGVTHLLRAAHALDPQVQLVLLAGTADTAQLRAETDAAIQALLAQRDGVLVVDEMLPRESVRQVLSHALAFVCPSVYEPLGIVNLEAMACGAAVVASAVGGIPEVVVDGVTGLLVTYDEANPAAFEAGLAAALNRLAADPELAAKMGAAGRRRAVESFGWRAIAEQTLALYRELCVRR
ncbi:MAG TPA: glycogen synthase [Nocardioidaceae bacterium]|nr:glycogen synthase [Nocardioidaceae bacterium]